MSWTRTSEGFSAAPAEIFRLVELAARGEAWAPVLKETSMAVVPRSKTGRKATTLRLPPKVKASVKRLSEATGISQQKIMENAIRLYADSEKMKKLLRAAEAAGIRP